MKILVPTDGSKYADQALVVAIDLVKRAKGGELCLISVAPAIEEYELEFSAGSRETISREFAARAARVIEKGAALAETAGVKVTCKSETSAASIPDAIVDYAEKEAVDLIVIGTRGLSPSSRFRMGSVASKVVRHAHCSVYVVKKKA
jgi:nucleotide-binding universal stress UspA family protein